MKNDKISLWCRVNAKEISFEKFEKLTGEDFLEFGEKNKMACLRRWRLRKGVLKVPTPKRKAPRELAPLYLYYKRDNLKKRWIQVREQIRNWGKSSEEIIKLKK